MSNYSAVKWLCNGGATVTICGSTKFFSQIMECNRRLTFWINKVYLVAVLVIATTFIINLLNLQKVLKASKNYIT